MAPEATSNPIGPFRFRVLNAPVVRQPNPEVAEKQDETQTEGDFLRDLDKATRRKSPAS